MQDYQEIITLVLSFLILLIIYGVFKKYTPEIEKTLRKIIKDEEYLKNIIKTVKYVLLLFGMLWILSLLGFQIMLTTKLLNIRQEIIKLPTILLGILIKIILTTLILCIGFKIAQYLTKILEKPIFEITKTRLVASTFLRGIKYGIIILSIGIALYVLGFEGVLTSLAAGIGIASIIIGVAAGPIIMSFLSGIFILGDKPFEIGDFIEIPSLDISGKVVDVGIRITKIKSTRGNLVIVPNNEIIKTNIINYKKEFPYVKIVKKVQISYDSDMKKAVEIILDVLKNDEDIAKGEVYYGKGKINIDPKAFVLEFADSGINIEFWLWIKDYNELKEKEVASRVHEKIFEKFKENGIEIPYPHRVIINK